MGEQIKLPALQPFEDRLQVLVQGEWNGQRIAETLTVDYWLMAEESPAIEADDVQVLQLWDAAGNALLDFDGAWKLSERDGYLAQIAAFAVAGAISEGCRQQADEWLGYEGWPGGADFAGNSHQMTLLRGVL
jgi:hypothetical protein